jgi:protein TonB
MERSGLRSHLSGTVPISIALHLVALLLFLIIPLTANMILPDPASHLPDYMRVVPMPPPPPVARATSAAAPTPNAPMNPEPAPTTAPSSINPEPAPAGVVPDLGMPAGTGVPDGIGFVTVGPPGLVQPPDPPRPSGPVRVADLPVSPVKIADARPIYPDIARAAHVEGTVIMVAVLDTTGRVTQLRVLKSAPMLDQAALDAVRQWRYTPSLYGGHPVSVLMTITVRFQLQ